MAFAPTYGVFNVNLPKSRSSLDSSDLEKTYWDLQRANIPIIPVRMFPTPI